MIRAYTPFFRFPLIQFDSPTWAGDDDARWQKIDSLLSAIQDGDDVPYAVAIGNGGNYVVTYSPPLISLNVGTIISFTANHAAPGAATVNVNGLGAKALLLNGLATVAGDLPNGVFIRAIYNGTSFDLIDPKKPTNAVNFIRTGSSGGMPSNLADDFYVETGGTGGISLLSPESAVQYLIFASPSEPLGGGFIYNQNVNVLQIITNGAVGVTINEVGAITSAAGFYGPHFGDLLGNVSGFAGRLRYIRTITANGDVTGGFAFDGTNDVSYNLTLADACVTNAKLANMAGPSFKGRIASTGTPQDLTPAQATALLSPLDGADGSNPGLQGLAPAPLAGEAWFPLMGEGVYKRGVARYAGVNIGTTSVNGSNPTENGMVNIASVSNVAVQAGSLMYVDIVYDHAFPDVNYAVHITIGHSFAGSGRDYGYLNKNTTGIRIVWHADYGTCDISVSMI